MDTKTKIILVVFLGIGAFFLLTEHRAHLYGFLPYSFLLFCVFMHVFMHGGHNGKGNHKH